MKCYICNENEVDSEEHIIPDSIGGKESAKILCTECNNKMSPLNQTLANGLLFCRNELNIRTRRPIPTVKGDMGGIPVEKTAGTDEFNGIKIDRLNINDRGFDINIFGIGEEGKEKALSKFADIINSFAQKHKLDSTWIETKIAETKENIKETEFYKDPFHFSMCLGGKDIFLSCINTAVNLCISNGIDKDKFKDVIDLLLFYKNNKIVKEDVSQLVKHYYPENFFPTESIYHTLYVHGDKKNNKIFCLLSYFGIFQKFILLNDNYNGENFELSYNYDLLNHIEIPFTKTLYYNELPITDILGDDAQYNDRMFSKCREATHRFLFLSRKDKLISGIINKAENLVNQNGFLSKNDFILTLVNSIPDNMPGLELVNDKTKCIEIFTNMFVYRNYLHQKAKIVVYNVFQQTLHENVMTSFRVNNHMNIDDIEERAVNSLLNTKTENEEFDNVFQEEVHNFMPYLHDCIKNIKSQLNI
jgi:hypothetical protein